MAKQTQGEKTLLESEERFLSVAETATESIITIDSSPPIVPEHLSKIRRPGKKNPSPGNQRHTRRSSHQV